MDLPIKIAGLVILYNPEISVLENINSYINQVDKLFVFDNSENDYSELLEDLLKNTAVIYESKNENLGVGYALNYAADRAFADGFDFLLTMDQDSFAEPGMVSGLVNAAIRKYEPDQVGIISPLHTSVFGDNTTNNEVYEEMSCVKTSGNLLNLKLFQKIGKFKEEYFIDYLDIEYGFRLNINGLKVLRINNIKLVHNEADISENKFIYRKVFPYNHSPERMYYKTRNYFSLKKEYKKSAGNYLKAEKKAFIRNMIKVLLFEKNKRLKLKYCLEGFFDYRKGVTGKYSN